MNHGMKDSGKPIVYEFCMGSEVNREFHTIDVSGKRRRFRICINDEQGITSCKFIADVEKVTG
jgi:hypothetical protein